MKHFLTLLSFVVLFGWQNLYSQDGVDGNVNSLSEQANINPLELIRRIDEKLTLTKLEAMQSGNRDAFNALLNKAKSFVHSEQYDKAEKSYSDAITSVWGQNEKEDLRSYIKTELNRNKGSLSSSAHPKGLDENYQPAEENRTAAPDLAKSYTPATANIAIDSMLVFLKQSVYKQPEDKLALEGKLNACRHLVRMEEFNQARDAYHDAIIGYLDPKWTSQLLVDIDTVLSRTQPIRTPSELNANMTISREEAIEEVKLIIQPLADYFGGNAPMETSMDTFYEELKGMRDEEALESLRTALLKLASEEWVDNRLARMEAILHKTAEEKEEMTPFTTSLKKPMEPILYFKEDAEGRSIEHIRIIEQGELMTYKKVTHNWGGKYYFINDDPTKDTEWLRVWRLYEAQQNN